MLVLGLLFLLWQWLRPAEPPAPNDSPPGNDPWPHGRTARHEHGPA